MSRVPLSYHKVRRALLLILRVGPGLSKSAQMRCKRAKIVAKLIVIRVAKRLKRDRARAVRKPCAAHGITQPPSIVSTCPVIYDASDERRNATAGATSSTFPKRPMAIAEIAQRRWASGTWSSISVST
jgi:hypothetical protein